MHKQCVPGALSCEFFNVWLPCLKNNAKTMSNNFNGRFHQQLVNSSTSFKKHSCQPWMHPGGSEVLTDILVHFRFLFCFLAVLSASIHWLRLLVDGLSNWFMILSWIWVYRAIQQAHLHWVASSIYFLLHWDTKFPRGYIWEYWIS